jgi:L-aminopeptidase/D-esterase-like protein
VRARELGIGIGELEPGPLNAITDVDGVLAGRELGVDRIPGPTRPDGSIIVLVATEEAIVNALLAAEATTGHRGNTAHALDGDALLEVMRRYGR